MRFLSVLLCLCVLQPATVGSTALAQLRQPRASDIGTREPTQPPENIQPTQSGTVPRGPSMWAGPTGPSAGQTRGGLRVGTGRAPIDLSGPFYYRQINLVSDVPGLAPVTDPRLLNPWGIAFYGSNPFWIASNGSGVVTLRRLGGAPFPSFENARSVQVSLPAGSPTDAISAPTGVVYNETREFTLDPRNPSSRGQFIFATEDGTLAVWSPRHPDHGVIVVNNLSNGAVYKGIAMGYSTGPMGAGNCLYVTNFGNGTIDVFDGQFAPSRLAGEFRDPEMPAGYAPFGIQRIGSKLYVTYAMQDEARHGHVAGPGRGFVSVFDTDGNFLRRFASEGVLNAPWGLAKAPSAGFGSLNEAILVANAGDGRISAFNEETGTYLGQLSGNDNLPISIDGLWSIAFRRLPATGWMREPAFGMVQLFFTAGPNNQKHGLFGVIVPRPWDAVPPGAVPLRAPGGIASPSRTGLPPGLALAPGQVQIAPWGPPQ